jgi:nucleoside-diphosphate-sugar epimerase
MVTVAVAGGTTGIGSNVVREILATKKHQVVVLSRSERPALEKQGVSVRVVDYTSPDGLKSALQGIHTVISCIWSFGPEFGSSQLALLQAAQDAGVKRFVPSDWATDKYDAVGAYAAKATVWNGVKASGLEYTRFINGIWMNLWGLGTARDEAEALSGYAGPPFLIDLKKRTALIPGDGSQKLVFTNMRDVGKFVAASLDLKQWDPDSKIVGDSKSYGEVVKLAERITKASFEKTYYPETQIKTVLAGNPDPEQRFFHQFMQLIVGGELDFKPNVNPKFPEIKPTTAEEYLTKYWAGV